MNVAQIFKSLEALKAYDGGAHDSGVNDEELRQYLLKHLGSLSDAERRVVIARCVRTFLSDAALQEGYGLTDVMEWAEWLRDQGVEF